MADALKKGDKILLEGTVSSTSPLTVVTMQGRYQVSTLPEPTAVMRADLVDEAMLLLTELERAEEGMKFVNEPHSFGAAALRGREMAGVRHRDITAKLIALGHRIRESRGK